ncbi:MAG TPA: hypothetical protein VFZ64_01280 [Nocardioidaceae bacterium]
MTHKLVLPFIPVAVAGVLVLGACAAPADEPARASLARAETSAQPSPGGGAQIDPDPSGRETPSGGEPWDASVSEACADAVDPGLAEIAQSPHESGATSFWGSRGRWVVCDVVAGEAVLVEGARDGEEHFDEQSLGFQTVLASEDGGAARFVAGGPLPWPVDSIGYTFPDGHVEEARFVDADGTVWWAMSYTATADPLADPEVDPATMEPVTVSVVGGAAEAFRLPW